MPLSDGISAIDVSNAARNFASDLSTLIGEEIDGMTVRVEFQFPNEFLEGANRIADALEAIADAVSEHGYHSAYRKVDE